MPHKYVDEMLTDSQYHQGGGGGAVINSNIIFRKVNPFMHNVRGSRSQIFFKVGVLRKTTVIESHFHKWLKSLSLFRIEQGRKKFNK